MNTLALEGLLYQTIYRLNRHYLLGWRLTRWLSLALLAFPFLFLFHVLPGEMTAFSVAWVPVAAAMVGLWRVRRRGFIRFQPQAAPIDAPLPEPLPFPQKVPVYASGNFAVDGYIQYFAKASAWYQAFETRERVLMVNIPQTRLLMIAPSPETDIGWWYAFFSPEHLRSVQAGQIIFGRTPQAGLQVTFQPDETDSEERVLLSFASASDCAAILADLQVDLSLQTGKTSD